MASQWGSQNPQWGGYNPAHNQGQGQGPYQPMQNYPAPGYPPQYAPPPQPPQQQQYHPEAGDSKSPYEGNRFKPEKRINDPIFLILFILQFLGFIAVSVITIRAYLQNGAFEGSVGRPPARTGAAANAAVTMNASTLYLLLIVAAAAFLLSIVYYLLVRAFTSTIMHITLVLSILLNIGICVYFWITKYYSGAIIFTVIAILSILSYFGFRSRIPLASLLLQVVMDVSKHHKSVFVTAVLALVVQTALSVWYVFVVVATYVRYTPGSAGCTDGCSSGTVAGLIFFETFSYIWTGQVVGNVALATMAGGPYGCWYYFGPRQLGEMPENPSLSAFGRASTRSLGSIAFGSLIVTILEMIRLVLEMLRNNAAQDGSPVEAALFCCAACCIGCIESMVEYFNRYAYIEIALYGKPYIEAAKDTWRLFKDRGIDALINDSLVGMTMTWGAYMVGLLCALFAYLYLRFTDPAYNSEGQYTPPILLFSFLIGIQCSMTLSSAIEAGVSTIFVGLGEDPHVLAMRAPELFGMIADTYPHITEGVPRV